VQIIPNLRAGSRCGKSLPQRMSGTSSLCAPLRRRPLEAACPRGLKIGARSYASISSVLQHRLDPRPLSVRSRCWTEENLGPKWPAEVVAILISYGSEPRQ
jgi:hypothetical protein